MGFLLEREMTPLASAWLTNQQLSVKAEYVTPFGVCDLVGCELNTYALKRQALSHLTVRRVSRLEIMQLLPFEGEGCLGISQVVAAFSGAYPTAEIRADLHWLGQRGFVTTSGKSFAKTTVWQPISDRVVAIELKLDRVDEVIYQASTRTAFADEVYIGMPLPVANRVARDHGRRSRLAEFGVGILGIDADQCHVVVEGSTPSKWQDPVLRALCGERFLAQASKQKLINNFDTELGFLPGASSSGSSGRSAPKTYAAEKS